MSPPTATLTNKCCDWSGTTTSIYSTEGRRGENGPAICPPGPATYGRGHECLELEEHRAGALEARHDHLARGFDGALGQEEAGGVADFGEAGVRHLEHPDLVGGAEAVLD